MGQIKMWESARLFPEWLYHFVRCMRGCGLTTKGQQEEILWVVGTILYLFGMVVTRVNANVKSHKAVD